MNDVVLADRGVLLYQKMQTAIAACYSIDDLLDLSNQAEAIAAYYKQLDDDELVRRFSIVKLRAVFRICEIFISTVSRDGCQTQMDYIRKIRTAFPDHPLSDSRMYHVLKFSTVPSDFVEQCINSGNYYKYSAIVNAYEAAEFKKWEKSPEGQAELRRREIEYKKQQERDSKLRKEKEEMVKEERKIKDELEREYGEFKEAFDYALGEVGVTLDRRDRRSMKQIVFLLKNSIYETLRQAAFDKRMTMQAVLRSGLAMWFVAHGYGIPDGLNVETPATPQAPPPPASRSPELPAATDRERRAPSRSARYRPRPPPARSPGRLPPAPER